MESAKNLHTDDNEQLLAIAHNTLQTQIHALSQLTSVIDSHFIEVAYSIAKAVPSTRILISAIGKAGLVAQKFSATLASIGIPSFYINPSEAAHGDLGRFTKDDIAVFISNSGETSELLTLLPSLQSKQIQIISITRSLASSLSRSSNKVIAYGNVKECTPLEAAPTTSTTVMMALCDALAMVCAHLKGTTSKEFYEFHPGGNLGRELMPVKEIMRIGDRHCIIEQSTITKEAIHRYTSTPGRPGAASIVNSHDELVGIFTDGDLRRLIDSGETFLNKPISENMGTSPKTVVAEMLAKDALKLLVKYEIDQLIVASSDQRPIGMVDIQDLAGLYSL